MQPSAARNKTAGPAPIDSLAGDVQYYLTLTPRQLPSRYLYDALGSALFEAICELPWYRITQAERALLERHAREIFARVDPLSTLVELGPGSGDKLAALISAGGARSRRLTVHLVDISAAALDLADPHDRRARRRDLRDRPAPGDLRERPGRGDGAAAARAAAR